MPPSGDERCGRHRSTSTPLSPPSPPISMPSPPHPPPQIALIPSSPSTRCMVGDAVDLRGYLWRLSPLDPHRSPVRSDAHGDSEMGIDWSSGDGMGIEGSSGSRMNWSSGDGMGTDWSDGMRSQKRRCEGMGIASGSHKDEVVPETELEDLVAIESSDKDVEASKDNDGSSRDIVQAMFGGVDPDAETDDESIPMGGNKTANKEKIAKEEQKVRFINQSFEDFKLELMLQIYPVWAHPTLKRMMGKKD